tara:strand:- start:1313 stop:1615 length:303 start_codon:yes stop_codon:yes gene_type:complete
MHAADDYFINAETGEYEFIHGKLGLAHLTCQDMVESDMRNSTNVIVVHNTFVQHWEMKAYYDLADKYGYSVCEIVCGGRFKSVHNVPMEKIDAMADRWEN